MKRHKMKFITDNNRFLLPFITGVLLLFASCSNSSLSPVMTTPSHHIMEHFSPFSKSFITSHSTGGCGDSFRGHGILHGVMEAMSPFQKNSATGHGGAGKSSPFAAGGSKIKKGGGSGDSFMQGKGKRKGDTNRENAFSFKIKKKGPPPEKHDVGLWPTYMRLK